MKYMRLFRATNEHTTNLKLLVTSGGSLLGKADAQKHVNFTDTSIFICTRSQDGWVQCYCGATAFLRPARKGVVQSDVVSSGFKCELVWTRCLAARS